MWQGRALRRADCVCGLGLVLLGGAVLNAARKMPMGGSYGGVDNPWYASPAAFPLLIGGLFVLSGFAIFLNGARSGALRGLFGALARAIGRLGQPAQRRGIIVVALLAGYYVLIRYHWIPGYSGENYIASSTVFLSVFALTFYRPQGRRPGWKLAIAIIAGAFLLSWGVASLFSGPLRVPLP
ncbi:MAG: tripartite tricarboxylate transporter TctB family protein [Verrucomicrobiota bacterium]